MVQVVGDGSFYFCNPEAVYAVSAQYKLPIFTVVLDNGGWAAVKEATLRMHPEGDAKRLNAYQSQLAPGMAFAKVAEAAGAYGETLTRTRQARRGDQALPGAGARRPLGVAPRAHRSALGCASWRSKKSLCVMIALSATFAGLAVAQPAFPSKPLRLVVGFPPGGANDILARLVGAKLQEQWGQPVVIENKPGANAIIATEFVARSAPDGYTLLVGASGAMAFNPGLYSKLPYDPVRDFEPVTMLGSFPLVFAVTPSVPAQSVKELVQLVAAAPGKYNYSAGSTPFQLAMELFKLTHRDLGERTSPTRAARRRSARCSPTKCR